ncbi:hypothetical protein TrRE_jg10793 [Triparma retinervis]|uniref:Uncharacterized protein n=1 Tax=Triparma retinervis TaxID=2557542 RepID=A0A9W6ZN98_9STRA|nr:hypothetical protein TrRE_jg10793 [Triparma retinervis]
MSRTIKKVPPTSTPTPGYAYQHEGDLGKVKEDDKKDVEDALCNKSRGDVSLHVTACTSDTTPYFELAVKRTINENSSSSSLIGGANSFVKSIFKCELRLGKLGGGEFMGRVAEAYGRMEGRLGEMERDRERIEGVRKEAEEVTSRISSHLQTREDSLLSNFVRLLNHKKAEIDELKRKVKEGGGRGGKEGEKGSEDETNKVEKKEVKKKKQSMEDKQLAYVESDKSDQQLKSMTRWAPSPSKQSRAPLPQAQGNGGKGNIRINRGGGRNALEVHGGSFSAVERMITTQNAKDESGVKRRKIKDPMLDEDSSDEEIL